MPQDLSLRAASRDGRPPEGCIVTSQFDINELFLNTPPVTTDELSSAPNGAAPTRHDSSEHDQAPAADRTPAGAEGIDGAALLDRVRDALTKFVVLPSDDVVVTVVLWIAATHAQKAWEHATRLVVKSPEKQCGKGGCWISSRSCAHRPWS